MTTATRPTAGELEERAAPDVALEGRRLRGLVPLDVESRDLGGWTERLAPGALAGARFDDLVCTLNHDVSRILGRFPSTLQVESRDDGLHWSCDLPAGPTGQDVREAVERGDLRATSWRMVVDHDSWEGDVRVIDRIGELRDVAVVTNPAYPSARAEYRSHEEEPMSETATAESERALAPEPPPDPPPAARAGNLRIEDRAHNGADRARCLTDRFRQQGFPSELAVLPFDEVMVESRALTVTGGPDNVAPVRGGGVALGADQRWAWSLFPRVTVDAGTTSVDVLRQTARSLAAAASTIRAIDAVTSKPETSSTVVVEAEALKQVASISKGIPNVYLESQAINSIVEADLRLAVNGGLDKMVTDALATAGHQDPATGGLLTAIRKGVTVVEAAGYAPDVVILDPASAESLDLLQVGGSDELYVFPPGAGAPGTIFDLSVRVAKNAAAPIVVDTSSVGRLYASAISLARFEENAGQTNTSTVRLETHALFNVERIEAAVRIAAS